MIQFNILFNPGRTNIRWMLSAAVVVVFLSISTVVLWLQTSDSLRKNANYRLELASGRINQMISHGETAVANVRHLAGEACTAGVLQQLQVQVAVLPDVRTISLMRDGNVYCSSVYGNRFFHTDNDFRGGQLFLVPGTLLIPDRSALVIRTPVNRDRSDVLVGIDGYYVHNILTLSGSAALNVYMRVGDSVMSPLGEVEHASGDLPVSGYSHHGTTYPFTIYIPVTSLTWWTWFSRNNLGVGIFLLLFSFLMGGGVYYYTGRYDFHLVELRRTLCANDGAGEIVPWIQPICTAEGRLVGGEILARWMHPVEGLLLPEKFIVLAEDNDLIIPMTSNLIVGTGNFFSRIQQTLPDDFYFSFNVVPEHFERVELIYDIDNFIAQFDKKRVRVVLEVTERRFMRYEQTRTRVRELQNRGVLVALDDFGTGHSNIGYLCDFRFDVLKIDKRFVDDIVDKIHVGNIVQYIVQLANNLGMSIVAEGVETREQLDALAQYHIPYYQGFWFSAPVNFHEFVDNWLQISGPDETDDTNRA